MMEIIIKNEKKINMFSPMQEYSIIRFEITNETIQRRGLSFYHTRNSYLMSLYTIYLIIEYFSDIFT